MSVSCFVFFKDKTKEDISRPIAAETEFASYWEKPGVELGLIYIPKFSEGLWIYDSAIILKIIDELKVLRDYWVNMNEDNVTKDPKRIGMVVERIDKLQALMSEVIKRWDEIENVMF